MNRHLPPILIALVLIVGCGPATTPTGAPSAATTPELTPDGSPGASPAGSPGSTVVVGAYFFLGSFTGDAGLVPVLRDVPQTQAAGTAAMAALLAGPIEQELSARPAMYTDVPTGTRFLSLTIDGGVATVNLSQEFQAGGDSQSVAGRIAQVVYTLTQFPTLQSVRFEFDGAPATTVFSGTFGRSDYTDFLPAIWVDRPAWGGVLGNPGRITGLANVFEARFHLQVLDAAGDSLADVPVIASCGTGCWGTFDGTGQYSVAGAQWGTLRVYDLSAKDGSREHVVEYPVWLTP